MMGHSFLALHAFIKSPVINRNYFWVVLHRVLYLIAKFNPKLNGLVFRILVGLAFTVYSGENKFP
jgi:hypothetical protein